MRPRRQSNRIGGRVMGDDFGEIDIIFVEASGEEIENLGLHCLQMEQCHARPAG